MIGKSLTRHKFDLGFPVEVQGIYDYGCNGFRYVMELTAFNWEAKRFNIIVVPRNRDGLDRVVRKFTRDGYDWGVFWNEMKKYEYQMQDRYDRELSQISICGYNELSGAERGNWKDPKNDRPNILFVWDGFVPYYGKDYVVGGSTNFRVTV